MVKKITFLFLFCLPFVFAVASPQKSTYYVQISCTTFLDKQDFSALQNNGFSNIEYIDSTIYFATYNGILPTYNSYYCSKIKNISPQNTFYKCAKEIRDNLMPNWAIYQNNKIKISIRWQKGIDIMDTKNHIAQQYNIEFTSEKRISTQHSFAFINAIDLAKLANEPNIRYIQIALPDDKRLNNFAQASSSMGYTSFSIANGGRNLTGTGITAGIGDDADAQTHIDLVDRLLNFNGNPVNVHGTHTMGTMAGAGNVQPRFRGILPKATIISQVYSNILYQTPVYKSNYNMTLTSNSYGAVGGDCTYEGLYDDLSKTLDELTLAEPQVTHVFAAGNDGMMHCPNCAAGYSTILGGYQTAKNIITVGMLQITDTINYGSSFGPIKSDNRLKPDVTALGIIHSTTPNNTYGDDNGTSMASPVVAGLVGQIVQNYKQWHGNNYPTSDLVKAVLINGAMDIGRKGPDFMYGYGRINADRSIAMIEKNNYKIDSIANGDSIVYSLNISTPNTMAKYLLHYNDEPANPYCTHCLVNDLDFYILDPLGKKHLPYVLNTTDTNTIKLPASTGIDSINNTEQIEMNYGAVGNYQLIIKGKKIVTGKQKFVVVWDTLQPKIALRNPIGSETFWAGNTEYILWDKYDTTTVTYKVEYTSNNGTTWITLANALPDNVHYYNWLPPASTSMGYKVRVTASNNLSATSNVFTATPLPVLTMASTANQCPTYANCSWAAIPNASDYLVLQKIGAYLQVIDSTTSTNYLYKNLDANTKYYFAIQVRINGKLGMQSNAIAYTPNIGTCGLAVYNNDLKIDTLLFRTVGRKITSTQFTTNENIKIVYSNVGNTVCNNYKLKYKIGTNPSTSQTITTPLLAHKKDTISLPTDLSAAQYYAVHIDITNLANTDPNHYNDTLNTTIRHLANDSILLSSPFTEGFETATDTTIFNTNKIGINGIERWDFSASSTQGRLRTFVQNGFAHMGNNAATVDVNMFTNNLNTDSLKGTFNLANYANNLTDIRLDFYYKHHNQYNYSADNAVYFRGADTLPWLKVYDLQANQPVNPGEYKFVQSVQLLKLLKDNNQHFSSSSQVKFTQSGMFKTFEDDAANGYTFDDIKLYTVQNDIALLQIQPLAARTCGLNNKMPITIQVQNTSYQTANNISVAYSIDGQPYTTESIASIAADTTINYTFAQLANLSAFGQHSISVYVFFPTDSYHANDSVLNQNIFNSPLITQFPYLQNFENNNGYFYSNGINNTWQYGTPNASLKINRAASGTKIWKTNLNGNYRSLENSKLYSPCFAINNLSHPYLSFSMAYQLENCGTTLCDGAFVEYSFDGNKWKKLDYDTLTNTNTWYSDTLYKVWNGNHTYWKSYSIALPKDTSGNAIQLRFALKSDAGVEMEGMAIDDIHIYDLQNEIYTDTVNSATITQNISSSSLTNFIADNQIFASLQSTPNDTMQNCQAKVYINMDSLRYPNQNYYIDRDITVKPSNKFPNDSVLVRIYFTQGEVDKIINDTMCTTCAKPRDAYDLGITKFTSIYDSLENGTLADNTPGIVLHKSNVPIVPYKNGYYAEMYTKTFSEFWLNYSADTNAVLNMRILNFTAKNSNNTSSLLDWDVETETNNHHFVIERAEGNTNFANNNFITLGIVNSKGNNALNNYTFSDINIPNYNQVYYYRLKWVNNGGEYGYTANQAVVFGNAMPWLLYPNPSTSPFVQYQIDKGKTLSVQITDMAGKTISTQNLTGTGFIDKYSLQTDAVQSGIYFIKLISESRTDIVRWVKW